MDYDASLPWLLTLPDFERTGEFEAREDLAPMLALLTALDEPHRGRVTVHIAGSKGKGSTGAMVEAIAGAAGKRTGYYISPHLHRFNERIRIAGEPLERDAFGRTMTLVREAMDAAAEQLPERRFVAFDALTAAAFVAFREADVALQIVEVGLGGRLDPTNVFGDGTAGSGTEGADPPAELPHIVVLTPISLEHTAILGGTVPAIAREKAGIITPGSVVVAAPQRESAMDVFREVADWQGATLISVAGTCQLARSAASAQGQRFKLKTARAMYQAQLSLAGRHQLDNAATAVVACEELAQRMGMELTPAHVAAGLQALKWPGRLEVLRQRPQVIIDGAHNGDSAKRMTAALRDDFALSHAVFLFGTLSGKDATAMAEAIAPMADHVSTTAWPHDRAAKPQDLAAAFRQHDVPASAFADLPAAYESALAQAGERGALVAFGSIAFVAAVREYVLGIESDMIRLRAMRPSASSESSSGIVESPSGERPAQTAE